MASCCCRRLTSACRGCRHSRHSRASHQRPRRSRQARNTGRPPDMHTGIISGISWDINAGFDEVDWPALDCFGPQAFFELTFMKLSSALLCASLLSGTVAWRAAEENESAVKLVHAAQLDFMVVDALVQSNGRVMFDADQFQQLSPCILEHGPGLFTTLIAEKLSGSMTEEEMRTAVDFFASPLGKKYVEATLLHLHHQHQIDLGKEIPDFSVQERSRVMAFQADPATAKIGRATAIKGLLDAMRGSILQTCAAQ